MTERHFKVIAHRGNSSEAPENTRAAFEEAILLGADFIECDVQLTKDLVPVIIHDSTVHRILASSEESEVSQLNWEKLRQMDAGSWFDPKYSQERILSLSDFLHLPKGKVGAMIEIKRETFKESWMAKIAADIVRDKRYHRGNLGEVIVGSLSPDINIWLEEHIDNQSFIAIVETAEDLEVFLKKTDPKYYGIRYHLATKELIHFLRSEGKEVWVWTVDDKDTAKKLLDNGVQGIITNHPKKMLHMHLTTHDIL